MKRSGEFIIIYLLFLIPRILAAVFLNLNSKGIDIALLASLSILTVIIIVPALLLSVGFAFLIKKKKPTISRLKYYICLFSVSIILPLVLIVLSIIISLIELDFSLKTLIYDVVLLLNVGLPVVFLHWLFEWVAVNFNNKLRLFLKIFASLLFVPLFTLLLFGTSVIIAGNFPFGLFIVLIVGILASPLFIAKKIIRKILKNKNKSECPEEVLL